MATDINTPTAVPAKFPAINGVGPFNGFTDTPPDQTELEAIFFDLVMMEILSILQLQGIPADALKIDQIAQAINNWTYTIGSIVSIGFGSVLSFNVGGGMLAEPGSAIQICGGAVIGEGAFGSFTTSDEPYVLGPGSTIDLIISGPGGDSATFQTDIEGVTTRVGLVAALKATSAPLIIVDLGAGNGVLVQTVTQGSMTNLRIDAVAGDTAAQLGIGVGDFPGTSATMIEFGTGLVAPKVKLTGLDLETDMDVHIDGLLQVDGNSILGSDAADTLSLNAVTTLGAGATITGAEATLTLTGPVVGGSVVTATCGSPMSPAAVFGNTEAAATNSSSGVVGRGFADGLGVRGVSVDGPALVAETAGVDNPAVFIQAQASEPAVLTRGGVWNQTDEELLKFADEDGVGRGFVGRPHGGDEGVSLPGIAGSVTGLADLDVIASTQVKVWSTGGLSRAVLHASVAYHGAAGGAADQATFIITKQQDALAQLLVSSEALRSRSGANAIERRDRWTIICPAVLDGPGIWTFRLKIESLAGTMNYDAGGSIDAFTVIEEG